MNVLELRLFHISPSLKKQKKQTVQQAENHGVFQGQWLEPAADYWPPPWWGLQALPFSVVCTCGTLSPWEFVPCGTGRRKEGQGKDEIWADEEGRP